MVYVCRFVNVSPTLVNTRALSPLILYVNTHRCLYIYVYVHVKCYYSLRSFILSLKATDLVERVCSFICTHSNNRSSIHRFDTCAF